MYVSIDVLGFSDCIYAARDYPFCCELSAGLTRGNDEICIAPLFCPSGKRFSKPSVSNYNEKPYPKRNAIKP